MNVLEKIIKFLQFEMEEPTLYGWFHILSLVLTVVIIMLLVYKKPNIKKTLLVMSIIMIIFEIYKQLSFSFSDNNWEYQWYAFPFQFCSVPMYVGLIAGITKNKKLENTLYSFLGTYGLIAGISVMLYPSTVYVEETMINMQTMIHHGFMIIMGIYLLVMNYVKPNLKTLLNGLKVFIIVILIALLGNITTYYIGIDNGLELFYISPFHTSSLPVFSIIYDNVPYILFLIIYILIFTLGSGIPLLIKNLSLRIKNKFNKKD